MLEREVEVIGIDIRDCEEGVEIRNSRTEKIRVVNFRYNNSDSYKICSRSEKIGVIETSRLQSLGTILTILIRICRKLLPSLRLLLSIYGRYKWI